MDKIIIAPHPHKIDKAGRRHYGRGARQDALPEGLVALCNHAECGISVHFPLLIASCRL